MSTAFSKSRVTPGNWKLMIRVPDFITQETVTDALQSFAKQRPNPDIKKIQLETIKEGRCVQVMHIGPYATENVTIAGMTAFAKAQGLVPNGRHHEIYLSDPNRTLPEKMQTILRQPVKNLSP